MKQLAEENLLWDIVVHARIFAAGGLKKALTDKRVEEYLKERNVFVYTVDFDNGKVLVNKVEISNGEVNLIKIREYQVTLEHAELLNRSLRDRRITFQ